MKRTALIMAGGRGERFWPRSRVALPKQFISLTNDGKTMIQLTVERIHPLVKVEDIFIATGERYLDLVREQLPEIPRENILCEPMGRNTAPCVALAATHIQRRYGDAVMLVMPSDHLIKYTSMYNRALEEATALAQENEHLVTIGITPTYPETGYGYIQFECESRNGSAYPAKRFVEKPDFARAQEYLESEQYLWNSGIFIWKASSILRNMEEHLPALYTGAMRIGDTIGTPSEKEVLLREFQAFESISVDKGIMEKACNIFVIPGSFGWDDVGSWLAMERIQSVNEFGNVITGNVVTVDTKNCSIMGNRKLIAAIGVSDLVVVDTDDVLLVCQKQSAGDIKRVLETLYADNKTQYI